MNSLTKVSEPPLALVTGGARRLGRCAAIKLASLGYAILLHYNQADLGATMTANELRAMDVPVYPMKANLADVSQIDALFSYIDSLDHRIKVLINSAAVLRREDIRKVSGEDWDATMDINLRAPFLLSQAAAERMTDGGSIINISDAGAQKAWTGYPVYITSKASLDVLTKMMAKAYAPAIRVNAIAPGLVLRDDRISSEEWEKLVSRLPLKKPTTLDEIGNALEFLLKNESITGQIIMLDGGYSLI